MAIRLPTGIIAGCAQSNSPEIYLTWSTGTGVPVLYGRQDPFIDKRLANARACRSIPPSKLLSAIGTIPARQHQGTFLSGRLRWEMAAYPSIAIATKVAISPITPIAD